MIQGIGIRLRYAVYIAALYSLLSTGAAEGTGLAVAPPPSWVEAVEHEPNGRKPRAEQGQAGSRYLLVDRQIDVATEARFYHYAILIENLNGVQDQGRQTFDFDPSYQTLTFHRFDIIRDGQRLNRLDLDRFKTLQREADLSRHLYDESSTALLILEDLRAGDILDYSFTRTGANPVLDGKFVSTFSFQFGAPIDRIRCSIRAPADRSFSFADLNNPPKPAVTEADGLKTWTWERSGTAPILWNDYTPSSHYPYAETRISEYKSWKEVVDWALPLYEKAWEKHAELADHPALPEIYKAKEVPLSVIVRAAIEFVQDDIRYFGIETGPNSIEPHPAHQVLEQRFGDCKDKTVLLIALLRNHGVSVHPLLVNSDEKKGIFDGPPSPYAFDHVVALLERPGQPPLVVDATYSFQRGDISNRYQPSYEAGLLIKNGQAKPIELPLPSPSSYAVVVSESYRLTELNADLSMEVFSRYSGGYADQMRSYFKSTRSDLIEKSYSEYYGNYYDNLSSVAKISSADDRLYNEFSIRESYTVAHPWYNDTQAKRRTLSLYSPNLKEALVFPSTKQRTMPLGLPYPFKFDKTITVELPREWDIEDETKDIDNPFFKFRRRVIATQKRVAITYAFESKTNTVAAADTAAYLAAANDVNELLTFAIHDDLSIPASNPRNADVPALLFAIAFALLLAWTAFPRMAIRYATSPSSEYKSGILFSLRALFGIAALTSLTIFAYEAINYGRFRAALSNAEAAIFLVLLFQHVAIGTWLLRAALALAKTATPVGLGRKALAWHATSLCLWLIVRGGIQATLFGASLWLIAETAAFIALWLLSKLLRPTAAQPSASPTPAPST